MKNLSLISAAILGCMTVISVEATDYAAPGNEMVKTSLERFVELDNSGLLTPEDKAELTQINTASEKLERLYTIFQGHDMVVGENDAGNLLDALFKCLSPVDYGLWSNAVQYTVNDNGYTYKVIGNQWIKTQNPEG